MRIFIVNSLNFSHNIIKLFWVFNILYLLHNFCIVHLSSQMITLRTMQRWCSITFLVKYITHYIRLCKIFYTDEFSFYIDMRWYSKCMVIFFHMVLAKIKKKYIQKVYEVHVLPLHEIFWLHEIFLSHEIFWLHEIFLSHDICEIILYTRHIYYMRYKRMYM